MGFVANLIVNKPLIDDFFSFREEARLLEEAAGQPWKVLIYGQRYVINSVENTTLPCYLRY